MWSSSRTTDDLDDQSRASTTRWPGALATEQLEIRSSPHFSLHVASEYLISAVGNCLQSRIDSTSQSPEIKIGSARDERFLSRKMDIPGIVNVCDSPSALSRRSYLTTYSISGRPPVSGGCTRISAPLVNGFTSFTRTFFGGSARWRVKECRPTRGFDARHSKLKPKSRSDGVY